MKYQLLYTTIAIFLLCFSLSSPSHGLKDLASDRAALLALRSALRGRSLLWNVSETSPCSWTGVFCDHNRVITLRLPGRGLNGRIPLGIGNLTHLTTLSLRFNSISGSLPPDFANLLALRNLFLQGNFLSGHIPDVFFSMKNLSKINLANNNFTGEISADFNGLTRLKTLYLENNKLTGSIPDLSNAPIVNFNVSNNILNGSIPETLSRFGASAFEGNSLCGEPLISCNGTTSGKNLSVGAIAGIVIGSVVLLVIFVLMVVLLCKRKNKSKASRDVTPVKHDDYARDSENNPVSPESGFKNKSLVFFGNVSKVFDLDDLFRASAEVLGNGTFGTSYKAHLEIGSTVAVKTLKNVTASEKEFREEMEAIGKMAHENLIPLMAYYYCRNEKLLVYEFVPAGSLSALLHGHIGGDRTPLTWEKRCSIALGSARGIAYLHSLGPASSHGNIKSSNILLTRSYESRVTDFGLAKLALPASTPNRMSGYQAPEVTNSGRISQKADVYSFGVMLLELFTGKVPCNEGGADLPRWVKSILQEEWSTEVFDIELLRYRVDEEEMVQLLRFALECTAQHPDNRPSMDVVVSRIEEICHSSIQIEPEEAPDSIEEVLS